MRLIRVLVAFACLILGAIVGALNRQPVSIDFGVGNLPSSLGVALLVALLAGAVLGGVAVTAGVVLPMRRRLARAQRPVATPLPPSEA